MLSLPDSSPDLQNPSLPIFVPVEPDSRSPQQQYWDGFLLFGECDSAREYLDAGELAALTPSAMWGYNAAIAAKDAAEYVASLDNLNSFDDLTEH